MAGADLAIGAGGGTALERCAVGLPSIIIILADNQRELADALARAGAAFTLEQTDISVPALSALLGKLTPPRLADMARKARGVTDGRGAERVAEALIRLCLRAIRSNH
jgi:UDP-N-acetylglucosamine:LPS N-acetylglucosamine transferase